MENSRDMSVWYVKRILLSCFLLTKGTLAYSLTNLTATSHPAVFTSQNYPGLYPTSVVHYWSIMAQNKGDVVSVSVLDSEIEYGRNCQHDYVRIYDGPSDSYLRIGMFCGGSKPVFKSTGRTIYVKFKSDSSKPFRGFKIQYKSVSAQQSDEFTFSTKAVICSVLGILSTFLLFAAGNYFLRTARKSTSFRRPSLRRRTLTSVMYSISQSTGQTIVSIENGTRVQRSATGLIVPDDSTSSNVPEDATPSLLPPDYASEASDRNSRGFSMVLNVHNLRIAPPSYDSVRSDEDDSSTVLGEAPPAYEESTEERARIHRSMSLPS
ncbi:hypothetical protein LOTGIDRAFT_237695 [Lottia gigantea]|uniref:CUB domain-containing protein n=1 Tax=Lottia gigantea TaxID=225164 RepID=V4B770_LOTGI|nr:hypothetical protein LOTGIDRAFT_237695 [Lottia gigantea]ESP03386.1 hypothetical protein LOTGIDRAFT_237695 [Lottia gigantea]